MAAEAPEERLRCVEAELRSLFGSAALLEIHAESRLPLVVATSPTATSLLGPAPWLPHQEARPHLSAGHSFTIPLRLLPEVCRRALPAELRDSGLCLLPVPAPELAQWTGLVLPASAHLTSADLDHLRRALRPPERRADPLGDTERLEVLGRRMAAVAHELGGPLQAIISLAELLSRDPAREDRVEAANRIFRSALRCRGLVQDLLGWARKRPIRLQRVDVHAALLDALELDRYSDVGEIQVRLDEASDLPAVLADSSRLTQVLLNLLTNARQAMAHGHGAGIIRIGLRQKPGRESRLRMRTPVVEVTVEDDGPGIASDQSERIFEPFVTTKPQGSGLGLSIARELIHEAGGQLWLESHAPRGAKFVIELPAAAADPEPPPTGAATGARVLVVDDDHEILATYEALLSLDDHRVQGVDRADKALALLATEVFDVILCDLLLPDQSGEDFYAGVRARYPDVASRIVFATGDVAGDASRRFLDTVPNPVLVKPFQADDLSRAIREVMSKNQDSTGP